MQPFSNIGLAELLIIGGCCLSIAIAVIALVVIIVVLTRIQRSD